MTYVIILPMLCKVNNILTYLYKYLVKINRFCSKNGRFMIQAKFCQKFWSVRPKELCFLSSPALNLCLNPNSLAPFFVSSLSPRKGRRQKMGVPPGFRTRDPPHHNALFTHGTPPGCRCPGSDFVPI